MKVQTRLPEKLIKELSFPGKGIQFDVNAREGITINEIANGQPIQIGPEAISIPYHLSASAELSEFGRDGAVNLLDGVGIDADDWRAAFQTLYDQNHANFRLCSTGSDFGNDEMYPDGYDPDSVDFSDSEYECADDQFEFDDGQLKFTIDFAIIASISIINHEPQFAADAYQINADNPDFNAKLTDDRSLLNAVLNADGLIDDVSVDYNPFTVETIDYSQVSPVTIDPPYRDVDVDRGTDENATFALSTDLTVGDVVTDSVFADIKQRLLENIKADAGQLFKTSKPEIAR